AEKQDDGKAGGEGEFHAETSSNGQAVASQANDSPRAKKRMGGSARRYGFGAAEKFINRHIHAAAQSERLRSAVLQLRTTFQAALPPLPHIPAKGEGPPHFANWEAGDKVWHPR